MAEIIFFFLFAVPALLGIAEILHTVKMWVFGIGKDGCKTVVIVPENDNFENFMINCAKQKAWYGKNYADRIVAVDSLLNEENLKACRKLAQRLEIIICSKNEIYDFL